MRFSIASEKKTGWGLAVFLSLVFNWTLFSIMPGLIRGVPGTKMLDQPIHAINVIRAKPPEEPVKKKIIQKQTPEEKVSDKKIQREISTQNKSIRLKMPFELNLKLSEGQGNIPTLFMEKYALNGIEAYEAGEIDQPIAPIARIKPTYPMRAKRLGIEGFVTVKMLVNEKGLVERTEIVNAQPEGIFEKSVLKIMPSWRFTPGTIDGVPVKTFVTTTIRFNLENES